MDESIEVRHELIQRSSDFRPSKCAIPGYSNAVGAGKNEDAGFKTTPALIARTLALSGPLVSHSISNGVRQLRQDSSGNNHDSNANINNKNLINIEDEKISMGFQVADRRRPVR